MSFSGEIKEELSKNIAKARHCCLAELSAIVSLCGIIQELENGQRFLRIYTENVTVIRKCFTLLEKTYNIRKDISMQICVRRNLHKGSVSYLLYACGRGLQAIENASIQAVCCKRAYLRGAFLAAGSISDPRKSYHFEIVCSNEERAEYLKECINSFGMDAKIVKRKNNHVVYLKEGAQIVDVLNVMEAHVALMELENVRILKEVRNSVNRKVNCETANINKTISASVKQIEDIEFIRDTVGLDSLPEGLQDVVRARLAYPEAALKELGNLMDTPIGKSGVNHRLRKISEMADKLRKNQEEHYDQETCNDAE